MATQGKIRAAPSTADWQRINSLILERCRTELRVANQPRATAGAAAAENDEAWVALLPWTGGADCFTTQDAREEGCGGACEECLRALGALRGPAAVVAARASAADSRTCVAIPVAAGESPAAPEAGAGPGA